MHSHITLRNIWLGFVALPWRSASAIDACASFSRFTSAFEAMQYTRDTSTASVSPFRGGNFLCWIALRIQPAILVLFVSPSSFLTSHWSRPLFLIFNICVDLAPHRERHRLGFIVSHSHLWPVANGAHAYVFAYPCFGRCSRRMQIGLCNNLGLYRKPIRLPAHLGLYRGPYSKPISLYSADGFRAPTQNTALSINQVRSTIQLKSKSDLISCALFTASP